MSKSELHTPATSNTERLPFILKWCNVQKCLIFCRIRVRSSADGAFKIWSVIDTLFIRLGFFWFFAYLSRYHLALRRGALLLREYGKVPDDVLMRQSNAGSSGGDGAITPHCCQKTKHRYLNWKNESPRLTVLIQSRYGYHWPLCASPRRALTPRW